MLQAGGCTKGSSFGALDGFLCLNFSSCLKKMWNFHFNSWSSCVSDQIPIKQKPVACICCLYQLLGWHLAEAELKVKKGEHECSVESLEM